jgi:hypothetical protein
VAFIARNIASMQGRPLNGIAFKLAAEPTVVFDATPRTEADVPLDQLRGIDWGGLTDNFLLLFSSFGTTQPAWFDDAHWQQLAANAALYAKAAKAARAKGILFDTEPYGIDPWTYRADEFPGQTAQAVRDAVRQRGGQFMRALQSEFADIKVLMLFAMTEARKQIEYAGSVEAADYGLLAEFIDGMLDVLGPQAQLIDGNEPAYYYTEVAQFDAFRDYKQQTREYPSPENRLKYDQQVKVGHGLYVDGALNLWTSPRFFGHYLASDAQRRQFLERNLYHALRTSDEYVWLWNENMDWWGTKGQGVSVPAGLSELLQSAQGKLLRGEPLGFDVDAAVAQAKDAFDQRVTVSGRLQGNDADVGSVMMRSGAPVGLEQEDPSCNAVRYNPAFWQYECVFPRGWSGLIRPEISGTARITPDSYTFSALQADAPDQDFSAAPLSR